MEESVLASDISARFLECPICFLPMDKPTLCITKRGDGKGTCSVNAALYSACHSFCNVCIAGLFEKGDRTCPECRQEIVGISSKITIIFFSNIMATKSLERPSKPSHS